MIRSSEWARLSTPRELNITLQPLPHLLQAGELAFQNLLPALEIGARFQAMVADLKVIAEIGRDPQRERRKDECPEPHEFPEPVPRDGRVSPGPVPVEHDR